jgi:hypothetical protein
MPDRETVAAQLMLIAAMKTKLRTVEDQLRADMDAMVKRGAVEPVTLPSSGETVGKVRKDAGAGRVALNWPRVTEWCRAHYPATVRQAWEVLPGYRARLETAASTAGVGVDPETGEMLPEDCWAASAGADVIKVVPTPKRADLLEAYLAEGLALAGELLDTHQAKEIDHVE